MIISGTGGDQEARNPTELQKILRNTRTGAYADFWLGFEKFPVLAIQINGNLAYIHYLPSERHPGFQVVADNNAVGEVEFKQEGDVGFSMWRGFVIDVEKAYEAAEQFFKNPILPDCIKWAEL